jgi:myosin heavy subunit
VSRRRISLALSLGGCLLGSLLPACDDDKPAAGDELTIVVRGDRRELELQEQALQQREQSLRANKAALDAQLEELSKGLKNLSTDAVQRRKFDDELSKTRELQREAALKLDTLQAQKTETLAKKNAIDPPMTQVVGAALAAREAAVASREAKAAERDEGVSRREKELAAREQALAAREKELADKALLFGGGSGVRTPSARDIPKLQELDQKHKKLLDTLSARGILIADLPVEDQPLNAEVFAARNQGDLAHASDLLAELGKAVRSVKIDQRFVETKMIRLQGLRAQAPLVDEKKREVERLLSEVTSAYNDGRYEQANVGLNRISKLLDVTPPPG